MSFCISIAGFIVFFENCRPFTKFRKVLYAATLFVVLLVLYLIPEYFIISGTDMLKEAAGFLQIIPYIINHLGKNAILTLYRTMTLEQGLFLLIYALLAYPLYLLNRKFAKWIFSVIPSQNKED